MSNISNFRSNYPKICALHQFYNPPTTNYNLNWVFPLSNSILDCITNKINKKMTSY